MSCSNKLVPSWKLSSNHYLLLYYIKATLQHCFQVQMQFHSGLSWSRSQTPKDRETDSHTPHPQANHEVIPSESPGRTFWKMENNPKSVKPRVSQMPIILEHICTTSDPNFVSVSQDSLTGGRLILGSKSPIIQMPPVYSIDRLVKHDNITFTSKNHTCDWLFPDEWKVGCNLGLEIRENGNLNALAWKSMVVDRKWWKKNSVTKYIFPSYMLSWFQSSYIRFNETQIYTNLLNETKTSGISVGNNDDSANFRKKC